MLTPRLLLVPALLLAATILAVMAPSAPAQPADLDEALEKATKAALEKVAPAVVRIRTVGGLEIIGGGRTPQIRKGEGPTTGVIVAPDGYIISSSFNFVHKPSAILVDLPGGKEPVNAQVVAMDETRMLTLLKVEAKDLPMPEAAPKKEVKIGQWALSVGRTWSETPSSPPSVSVGIVSALDRVWGKAIQADAKISPVNYGGPLVDLKGRVIGILVPLSPRAEGETAGADTYDSGIGFAIPLEDVNRVLPQLKQGKNLKPGILGVRFRSQDDFGPAVIGSVVPGSPGAKAGIKAGDKIIEADGAKVERQAQARHVFGNKYEGDKVALKVEREGKTEEFPEIVLGGTPGSQPIAFLGILPMRDDPEPGLEVRYVFPKSPADTAGIKAGDRIMKIETNAFSGREQFMQRFNPLVPGAEIKLELKRKEGGKTDTVSVKLADATEAVAAEVPAELPLGTLKKAKERRKPAGGPGPRPMPMPPPAKEEKKDAKKGFYTSKDDTTGHEYWAYVPEGYDENISYALMVWLQPIGDPMDRQIPKIWKEHCEKHHVIILAPKMENPTGWVTSDIDAIKADMREMLGTYTIDRNRIVLHGLGNGGSLAFYLGFDARDLVRGVATIGGVLTSPAKDNNPAQRLSFFMVVGGKDPALEAIKTTKPKLAEKKFPIIYHELPEHGNGYLEAAHADLLRQLARWVDSLDRI